VSTALLEQAVFVKRGLFAARVVEALGVPPGQVLDAAEPVYPAHIPYASILITLTPGRDSGLRDRMDSLAFTCGMPSLGVELHPSLILCGPVVIPGRTACFLCYERRSEQHQPGLVARLREDAELPEGFANHHVIIGAGLIDVALREVVSGPEGVGGTVRSFDLSTGMVTQASTLAVDHCPRCGARFRSGPGDAVKNLCGNGADVENLLMTGGETR
jgi:bacteriocin biosynthesis cyclodehydratase domain-containing protein